MGTKFDTDMHPSNNDVKVSKARAIVYSRMRPLLIPNFRKLLETKIRLEKPDIIHDHCMYLPTHFRAAELSQKYQIPMFLSTRGMLEDWASKHHYLRKKIVWLFKQKKIIRQLAAIHVTSDQEQSTIEKLDLDLPIFKIPNGVSIPQQLINSNEALEMSHSKEKNILFLSRIHPVKGLTQLIQALSEIKITNWHLTIVGPVEGNYIKHVKSKISDLGLNEKVDIFDEANESLKWKYLTNADLFVLPSFTENFGTVIAEALAAGCPVITTTNTPWNEINTERCGWCIDLSIENLCRSLNEALNMDKDVLREMGYRGRKLVRSKYLWTSVAAQMESAYESVLK